MINIYRFTGPPENWLTGLEIKKWAVNSNNENIWNRLKAGDIALFHSTRSSRHSNKARSAVIGYAIIGKEKWIKKDLWWSDEIEDGQNNWPFVFSFSEIYTFQPLADLDLDTPVHLKSDEILKKEIEILSSSGVPLSELNERAKRINPSTPSFPVNGSASGVNSVYEDLLLRTIDDFYSIKGDETTQLVSLLAEGIDDELLAFDKSRVLADAQSFKSHKTGYTQKEGVYVVRKDNEVQKRRVALIENYSCQVCGFKCEYIRKNGKKGWIIDIDHIIDKKDGGNEELSNLWALCPNCHRKKTRGVLTIDPITYLVNENGINVRISDSHLKTLQ